MKRKDFLKVGVLGGTMAGIGLGATACKPEKQKAIEKPGDFELDEITVDELQNAMKSGKYTAEKITRMYLDRINEIDKNGPVLNTVIELNPEAVDIARQLDKERKNGKIRGPLHSIPIMIKGNIDTADKMMTTAGALALTGNYAPKDSFIAQKLREAGAIILAKTNLSEWANFRSTHSSSGWSGRGGQTRNPNVLSRNPCGSSSGSGAGASANLCTIAIGTETDGSIVCPSSVNGVVGVKPTVGLWSRSGIIPISKTQDTPGPMCRTVRDAAILLGALTGADTRDPYTTDSKGHSYTDYTQFLDPNGLKGARIGVARNFFGFNDKVDEIMEKSIEAMKKAGAVIVDPANIEPKEKGGGKAEFQVLLYEFKAGVNDYLKTANPKVKVHTLEDVIEYNKKHKAESMPYFGQEILVMAEKKGPLTEKAYKDALAKSHRVSRDEGIDATMKKHNLDAIIAPTGGPAWTTDVLNGDHDTGGSSSPAAMAGYPDITVPAGYIYDLPIGISFFGAAWSEPKLLKYAYAFEQATKARRKPAFRANVGLPKPEHSVKS
ncbi:MAG TPA: amidase [Bacteroidales bacterium]|nr:amidase [Bacteroidales bacterium]